MRKPYLALILMSWLLTSCSNKLSACQERGYVDFYNSYGRMPDSEEGGQIVSQCAENHNAF